MENGEWRIENGEWRMENGEWKKRGPRKVIRLFGVQEAGSPKNRKTFGVQR